MNAPPNLEPALRLAALAGDAVAWQALLTSAFDPVARYCRWRCGRDDLTDDAVQETWLTAARKLSAFDPTRGSFMHWVCGLAANVCRNLVRSRLRQVRRVQTLALVPEPAFVTDSTAPDAEAIALALAELPDMYERVLRGKYLDGRSVAELAAEWGESEKAVESLLTRARNAFRSGYLARAKSHD